MGGGQGCGWEALPEMSGGQPALRVLALCFCFLPCFILEAERHNLKQQVHSCLAQEQVSNWQLSDVF